MPDSGSQAMVGTSPYYPHNHFHQHVHVHQHVDQIEKTLLAESYPTQPFVEEGKYYIVDVVFVTDPSNFFCQFVENPAPFNDLMEKLAFNYSGKVNSLFCI